MSYNPCSECRNQTCCSDCFYDECRADCIEALSEISRYKKKISRVIDKMEQWRDIYEKAGDVTISSIIGNILTSAKAIFEA